MIDDPTRARLLALAESNGTTLAALSRLIGRNASYLQQFIRKGSPRKLEENDRRRLAEFFGVGEEELGGGEGKENSYAKPPGGSPAGSAAAMRSAFKWVQIPRLPLGASAGPGAFSTEESPVGQLSFSAAWLRELGLSSRTLNAITVAGDSMETALSDGDEILVNRDLARLRDGIHVLRRDDTLLVKRLQFNPPGRVSIISDNAAYPPEHGVPLDEIEVIGRVVWKGGRV
ncbi:S24 family peptidase [Croceicoccus hydrothermalis]|uniref:S24 family peptidase n=1 Tax=Croceicoccus hydrothermalis TaxID=2867964 RepID=UPI001EFB5626|nr:S24 family peptidase [Croceicoccus hydrothermalis]